MTGYARGEQLQQLALAALESAGLAVTVTRDPRQIGSALRSGPVLVINPPDAVFPTWDAAELTWELHLITGPQSDRVEAWENAGPIIEVLAQALAVTGAKTQDYSAGPEQGPPWPGYILTLTETI